MRVTQDRMIIKSEQGDYPVDFVGKVKLVPELIDVGPETLVIIDEALVDLYGDDLGPLSERPTYRVAADEESKTLSGVSLFVDWLLENKATRSAHVVAIGGGVIQDIATFACHIYYRGVGWTFVPTTLLSQADSCIGAKSSINVLPLKNQLGVFHSPSHVIVCSEFLTSLPQIEVDSGYGEIYKLALTNEGAFFDQLAEALTHGGHRNPRVLEMIRNALESKRLVIEQDEHESDLRRVLNYGHSFGHALEALTHNEVPHGLAVMWGMDLINFLGVKWGLTSPATAARVRTVLDANTDYAIGAIPSARELVDTLKRDKKVRKGVMYFAVLHDEGDLRIVPKPLDEALVAEVAEYLDGDPLFAAR
ncbi:3-dehydroquinate synthase [Mycobacterium marinum]|uniref:3-dehydroquinate synthase n=1 Tax=Mycobacterium marinum TaxID=1781 RepID=UPI000DC6FCF5|nr:3-dehydroquinate synthase family protein [Mycobacterium marinum]AXN44265.1 3-dehydroquinate synthase [Mycobacterium marinum]AXN49635.1 3-dehydroquinate synthase [Mycobacterium marinum]RFZ03074.1 3-dehydroquinate synthase [Mycobacterium marinum]RFZ16134.1 3-dehydroquinate synthase [Mycobacterium marinum]RFZ31057.1 3-dehydroquinate synthase [Mycobacterium marinum]